MVSAKNQKVTSSLCERAMLVTLKVSMWTGRKKNKKVTSEVCSMNGASYDAGSWITYVIPPKALENILSKNQRCRSMFHSLTLPWGDGGVRILASALYLDYRGKMKLCIEEYQEVVEEFLVDFPRLTAEAQARLGKLAYDIRIPSVDEIRDKFAIRLGMSPIAESNDFRVQMDVEDLEEVKSQAEETLQNALDNTIKHLWTQFGEMIGKIADTMGKPDKIFRDSIIGNLKTFTELMPKLNLSDNPDLEAIRIEAVQKLSDLDPEDLRAIKSKRQRAAKDAADLLAKISQYAA